MPVPLALFFSRLFHLVLVIVLVSIGYFLLLRLAPGDPIDALLATAGGGDAGMAARLRAEYGLDRSLAVQLGLHFLRLLRLDLGWSPVLNAPVATVIAERIGPTLLLAGSSLGFAASAGILLGAVAAGREGGWRDRAVQALTLVAYAMPSFWVGLMLMTVFAVKLGWLPLGGLATIGGTGGGTGAGLADAARHLVLPVAALSLFQVAVFTRLMRMGLLETAAEDYVRTARAKGLSPWQVLWRHRLRNALLPLVTMVGVQASALFGGSVVVESLFAIPGIGRLAFDSVMQRDYPMLLGILFVGAVLVSAVNLAVDLALAGLDPRIRLEPPAGRRGF